MNSSIWTPKREIYKHLKNTDEDEVNKFIEYKWELHFEESIYNPLFNRIEWHVTLKRLVEVNE